MSDDISLEYRPNGTYQIDGWFARYGSGSTAKHQLLHTHSERGPSVFITADIPYFRRLPFACKQRMQAGLAQAARRIRLHAKGQW